jgi:hypothetical protein
MSARAALPLIVLAACGEGPHTVTFDLGAAPMFIAYRDGSAAWVENPPATVQADGTSQYRLRVQHPYEVMIVRAAAAQFDVEELFATPDDDDVVAVWAQSVSARLPAGAGATTSVDGQVLQTGRVDINGTPPTQLGTGVWSFHADVPGDVMDLVAIGDGYAVVIADQPLVAGQPVVVPAIDLDANGTALETISFTVSGIAADDETNTSGGFITGNGCAGALDSSGTVDAPSIAIVPPSLLGKGTEDFYVNARGTSSVRNVRGPLTESSGGNLELMPLLGGITYDDSVASASWTDLPAFTRIGFAYYDMHGSHTLTASQSWLDAMQAQTVTLDESAPSFSPDWSVTGAPIGHELVVSDDRVDATYDTGVFDPADTGVSARGSGTGSRASSSPGTSSTARPAGARAPGS